MVALSKCQWKSASCLEKAVVICEVILSVDNYKISVVVAFPPRRSRFPFCLGRVPFFRSSVPPPLYKSLILKEKKRQFSPPTLFLPYFYPAGLWISRRAKRQNPTHRPRLRRREIGAAEPRKAPVIGYASAQPG